MKGSEARVIIVDDEMALSRVERLIPLVRDELEEINAEERSEAGQIVERAAEILRGNRNLDVTSKIETGNPKRVLVEEADKWGADSIFIGSTGFTALERFLLGSVSAAVAARAHCSVEVVREKK
jgi:nucleotide-binding universal stress UspA family protein